MGKWFPWFHGFIRHFGSHSINWIKSPRMPVVAFNESSLASGIPKPKVMSCHRGIPSQDPGWWGWAQRVCNTEAMGESFGVAWANEREGHH